MNVRELEPEIELENYLEQPPLLIQLGRDFKKLPAHISIELPRKIARALIMRREALPVGDFNVLPDLVIEEDDLKHAGPEFDVWS